MIEIKDIEMSKVVKVRYTTEDERKRIIKALMGLETPVKTLKYTG